MTVNPPKLTKKTLTRNQWHLDRSPETTPDDRRRRKGRTRRIRVRKQPGFKLRQPRFLTADLASAQMTRQTHEQWTTYNNRAEATHQRRRQTPTLKSPKGETERRHQDRDAHRLTQQTTQRPTVRNKYTILADEMTEEDIGLHRTDTLDGNQSTNYTQTTPDEYTKKNVTDLGLHSTQDISGKTNFHTPSCTSKFKKPVTIHLLCPKLQLDKKYKMLHAQLHFENYEKHALLDTGTGQIAMCENLGKFKLLTLNHS